MSNIDKRALREIAESAVGAHERLSVMPPDDIFDISLAEGTQLDADITALNALNSAANPATVLALLDELEAAEKRIAELVHNHRVHAARLIDERGQQKQRIAELEASQSNLRQAMAGIHNTITGGGAYTPLAAILNASKRAYDESAAAAGRINGEG